MTGMEAYVFQNGVQPPEALQKPLRVLVLTSARDTGECDKNGQRVQTREGERKYMMGVVEHLVAQTIRGGALHGIVELAGVVYDDLPKDLTDYMHGCRDDEQWIYPYDLQLATGTYMREITWNIPSDFRILSMRDTQGRTTRKRSFEEAVLAKMQELGADVLLSDHYMARIDYLIGDLGLYGRVINIHPAVTILDSPNCFRGPTPTADAITAARDREVRTGATLHIVNAVIDDGPPIAYMEGTPVYADDEPQWLRYRNYTMAKLPLLTLGLKHYARYVYPVLDSVHVDNMKPIRATL